MEIQSEKKIKIAIIIIVIALAVEIIYVSGMLKSNKNKKQVESENILKTVEDIKKQNENSTTSTDIDSGDTNQTKEEIVIPPNPRTKPIPLAPKKPIIKR
ncbi:MAG: hypothetical protein PHZ07_00485 [Patescibacteria group bacterium]|nr:hypothetical protein [Patescibacteria group bacterium]MDD4304200.1 hypothetical protein [Patescibacteria group bacterium]MDD4695232.1 hypothetical protein [Patescibacteria group bacterium]